jgi:hypothetical protein
MQFGSLVPGWTIEIEPMKGYFSLLIQTADQTMDD